MQKILIIEDERMLAEMYKDKFSAAGYEVFSAFTSSEGVGLAQKHKPDLILLDILLPKESGLQCLAKIRKIPEISDIKVVALSNYDEPRAKREAMDLGVKDYLMKTAFTPAELMEKIKEYLPKPTN